MTERRPKAGQLYRHFKNRMYQVIAVAKHSETGEELVIYQALYGDYGIYARPLPMFVSEVDHMKYPNVRQKYRFEEVNRSDLDTTRTQTHDPMRTQPDPVRPQMDQVRSQLDSVRSQIDSVRSQMDTTRSQQMDPMRSQMNTVRSQQMDPTRPQMNTVRSQMDQQTMRQSQPFTSARSSMQEEAKWQTQKIIAHKYDEVKQEVKSMAAAAEPASAIDEEKVDPRLIQFLDAETYSDKYEVVASLKGEITQKLIDDFSVILDIVIPEGYLAYRYDMLLQTLGTMARYDNNRL